MEKKKKKVHESFLMMIQLRKVTAYISKFVKSGREINVGD